MKAVILAGGSNATLRSLSGDEPRTLLPFLNRPWLELQLRSLRDAGFREVGVALASRDSDAVCAEFGSGSALGISLTYRADEKPMGPGGCLRLFEDFVGEESFLVVHASSFLGRLDLAGLFRSHVRSRALVTLGLAPETNPPQVVEDVLVGRDGRPLGFETRYPDPNDVRRRKFAGVYAFSYQALRFIPPHGFVEIKEQLLSAITTAGQPLHSFDFKEFSGSADSPESYLRLQREELHRGTFVRDGYRECAPGVWVEHGASIADGARLFGPLLIGSRAVVDEGVHLVGPAVVGPECRIDSDAFVRESVLWPGAHVKAGERLEYAILGPRSWKRPAYDLDDIVRIAPKRFRGARASLANLVHRVTKRSIDLVAAMLGLVISLPLFALIALAIKLDSPGPIFFVQRRLGLGGRDYPMIKFRTMRPDAAGMQASMRHRNDVDGPMFKIFDDPRVTRLGWLLRRTSLDELPQLLNVLLGQMSLVGPRPLISEEMRLNPAWREIRLSVRPGITGPWQVSDHSSGGFQDWIRHDIDYVLHPSLVKDLRILVKTTGVLRMRRETVR